MSGPAGGENHGAALNRNKLCPCCNLPLAEIQGIFLCHESGQPLIAGYCHRCRELNLKMPLSAKRRFFSVAGSRAVRNPEKYPVRFFDSAPYARMAYQLLTDSDISIERKVQFFEA